MNTTSSISEIHVALSYWVVELNLSVWSAGKGPGNRGKTFTVLIFFLTFLFLQKGQAAEELALSWNLTNVLYVLKVLIKSSACRTTWKSIHLVNNFNVLPVAKVSNILLAWPHIWRLTKSLGSELAPYAVKMWPMYLPPRGICCYTQNNGLISVRSAEEVSPRIRDWWDIN